MLLCYAVPTNSRRAEQEDESFFVFLISKSLWDKFITSTYLYFHAPLVAFKSRRYIVLYNIILLLAHRILSDINFDPLKHNFSSRAWHAFHLHDVLPLRCSHTLWNIYCLVSVLLSPLDIIIYISVFIVNFFPPVPIKCLVLH